MLKPKLVDHSQSIKFEKLIVKKLPLNLLNRKNTSHHSPKILHHPILAGQVQEVQQKPQPLHDLPGLHAEDPAEVHHGLPDGELAVERDLLGHVAHTFAGDAGAWGRGEDGKKLVLVMYPNFYCYLCYLWSHSESPKNGPLSLLVYFRISFHFLCAIQRKH